MPITKLIDSIKLATLSEQESLHLCVAVMLFRLVRSDGKAQMLELVHMSELIRNEFSLDQDQLEEIFKIADEQESNGSGTDELAQEINENLSQAKRIKVLECLWRLAFSDNHINDAERQLIDNIGDHFGLSEVEKVTAQQNAETHLGLHLFS